MLNRPDSRALAAVVTAVMIVALVAGPRRAEGGTALALGSTDAYVNLGNPPALGLAAFTLEAWFMRQGAGEAVSTGTKGVIAVPLLSKGRHGSDGSVEDMNWFLGIRVADGVLAADFEEGGDGPSPGLNHPIAGTTPIVNNAWHHAAATYDGTTWRLYLDGALEAQQVVGRPVRADSTQQAGLGTTFDSAGRPEGRFDGALDEVRIWSGARSQQDIVATLNDELPAAAGLVARWSMDEGIGTTVHDSAGNAANGTIVGAGFAWVAEAPFDIDRAPDPPALVTPESGVSGLSTSPNLGVTVTDADRQPLTVTFYGREIVSSAPDFSLIALPDTQFYSSSLNGATPATFDAQTRWIVDQSEALNVAFVTHLGDCVQNGNNGGDDGEWLNASRAMGLLEDALTTRLPDGLPFGVTVGNHDESPIGEPRGIPPGSATSSYNRFFGVPRFAGRTYYGGHFDTSNDNHFELFRAGGMDFVIVHLAYDPSADPAVLAWADAVLTTYANRRAIVVSHSILGTGDPGAFSYQGQAIFNALRGHANLFLMLCGHVCGEGRRTDVLPDHTIHTLLSDYQCRRRGGDGWLRILRFTPARDRIEVQTYSPTLDRFEDDEDSAFVLGYPMRGGTFTPIATRTVSSGQRASAVWRDLLSGREYEWYVTVSDGRRVTTGPLSTFTTAAQGAPCASAQDCADQNPCTTDSCTNGRCVYTPHDGVPCDDGDVCTRTDVCDAGTCAGRDPVTCPGADACHVATCDPASGACMRATRPDGSPCDDENPCTAGEACLAGACVGGTAPACPVGIVETDTSVTEQDPATNFHAAPLLRVDGQSDPKYAYLAVRVDMPQEVPIATAHLRLQVYDRSASSSNHGGRIHASNCDWEEDSLTWVTRPDPPFEAPVLSAVDADVTQGQIVDFDVTNAIRDGVRCFAIDTPSANEVQYHALESTTGQQPELAVTTSCPCGAAAPPPTTTSSSTTSSTTTSSSATTSPPATDASTSSSTTTSASSTTVSSSTSSTVPAGTVAELEADTFVDAGAPQASAGAAPLLEVGAAPVRRAFLRFRVRLGGLAVRTALLRLEVARVAADDPSGGRVRRADCGWDEATLAWDGQPAAAPDVLDTHGGVLTRDLLELDVTAAGIDRDGTYCFVVENDSTSGVAFVSREGIGTPPELLLLAGPPSTTTTSTSVTSTTTSTTATTTSSTTTTAPPPRAIPAAVLEVARSVGPGTRAGSERLSVSARPRRELFLRFRVSGLGGRRATAAILRLHADAPLRGGPASGGRVHVVDRCDWTAASLSWRTRPPFARRPLARARRVRAGDVVDLDLRDAPIDHDGLYCFVVRTTARKAVAYEGAASGERPALLLTTMP